MSDQLPEKNYKDCREQMRKAIAHTQSEFASIRTGRATPALLDRIRVDYYGTEVPLQQIAGISVPDAKMLVVSPYDKGALGAIEKAIQNSDLGINPTNDGAVIRLSIPPLTEERRKEMVKVARAKAEDGRITIRNARRSARQVLDRAEKDGEISKDDLEQAGKRLDGLTKDLVEELDQLLAQKERELLEV